MIIHIMVGKLQFMVLIFYSHPRTCLLILERQEGKEREREGKTLICERNIDHLPLACTPTRDQACNPGMCLSRESNLRPFSLWDSAPTNRATLYHTSKGRNLVLCRLYVECDLQIFVKWASPWDRSNMPACFLSALEGEDPASHSVWTKIKEKIFCILILEVKAYHICHILFIKNKSLDFSYVQREEVR